MKYCLFFSALSQFWESNKNVKIKENNVSLKSPYHTYNVVLTCSICWLDCIFLKDLFYACIMIIVKQQSSSRDMLAINHFWSDPVASSYHWCFFEKAVSISAACYYITFTSHVI